MKTWNRPDAMEFTNLCRPRHAALPVADRELSEGAGRRQIGWHISACMYGRDLVPKRSKARFPGISFSESNSGIRYSVRSCYPLIGNFSNAPCCESMPEERRAGNPHAAFRGNRRRVTAFGDPVWRRATVSSDPVWGLNAPGYPISSKPLRGSVSVSLARLGM